jgi:hypothetical protein
MPQFQSGPAARIPEDPDSFKRLLVLFEILVRVPAFSPSLSAPVLMWMAVSGERTPVPETVRPELRSIIERGWRIDPISRRTHSNRIQD